MMAFPSPNYSVTLQNNRRQDRKTSKQREKAVDVGSRKPTVNVNRLREHLIAFFAHHSPKKLETTLNVHKIVLWCKEFGVDRLNNRFLKKYGDQIDMKAKLGNQKERILRLCHALTPKLSQELMKRAYTFDFEDDLVHIGNERSQVNKNGGKHGEGKKHLLKKKAEGEYDSLLRDLYLYYLKYSKEKLHYLPYFVAYAKKNGRDKLNLILVQKYGMGLSKLDDNRDTPRTRDDREKLAMNRKEFLEFKKKAQVVLKDQESDIKFDEKQRGIVGINESLRKKVERFIQRFDIGKMKAKEAFFVWTELMGESKTNEILARVYGETLKADILKKQFSSDFGSFGGASKRSSSLTSGDAESDKDSVVGYGNKSLMGAGRAKGGNRGAGRDGGNQKILKAQRKLRNKMQAQKAGMRGKKHESGGIARSNSMASLASNKSNYSSPDPFENKSLNRSFRAKRSRLGATMGRKAVPRATTTNMKFKKVYTNGGGGIGDKYSHATGDRRKESLNAGLFQNKNRKTRLHRMNSRKHVTEVEEIKEFKATGTATSEGDEDGYPLLETQTPHGVKLDENHDESKFHLKTGRSDSYLHSPALFMRNIPNILLTGGQGPVARDENVDYDDDTFERQKVSLRDENYDIHEILNRNEAPKQKKSEKHGRYEIEASMKLKSPVDKLKSAEANETSLGSLFSTDGVEKAEKGEKGEKKQRAGNLLKNVVNALKNNAPMQTPKLRLKNRKKNLDTTMLDLRKVEDLNKSKPENADFGELRAECFETSERTVRPLFESVVPGEFTTYSSRLRYLRGSNVGASSDEMNSNFKRGRRLKGEQLPINTLKLPGSPLQFSNASNMTAQTKTKGMGKTKTKTDLSNIRKRGKKSKKGKKSGKVESLNDSFVTTHSNGSVQGNNKGLLKRMGLGVPKMKRRNRDGSLVESTVSKGEDKRSRCQFVKCVDRSSANYGKCGRCQLPRDLHIGESFDEHQVDIQEDKACRKFAGSGAICRSCGHKKINHEWFAFDVPKQLLANKVDMTVPGDTPLTDNEI